MGLHASPRPGNIANLIVRSDRAENIDVVIGRQKVLFRLQELPKETTTHWYIWFISRDGNPKCSVLILFYFTLRPRWLPSISRKGSIRRLNETDEQHTEKNMA